jgi:cob(I)alamin adenosyltransferase
MASSALSTGSPMGNRLTRIYTRTGDGGTTGLADGQRIAKSDPRVQAFGAIDEANSAIGLVLAEERIPDAVRQTLTRVQNELFEAGAELSSPGHRILAAAHTERLESDLDALNAQLPPLEEFILPGGNRAAAACHLARTISRRAERDTWALAAQADVGDHLLTYLNRLSDYLFVAARTLARLDGGTETLWARRAPAPD